MDEPQGPGQQDGVLNEPARFSPRPHPVSFIVLNVLSIMFAMSFKLSETLAFQFPLSTRSGTSFITYLLPTH